MNFKHFLMHRVILIIMGLFLWGCGGSNNNANTATNKAEPRFLKVLGNPSENTRLVPVSSYVLLTFSEKILGETVNTQTAYIVDSHQSNIEVELSIEDNKISVIPIEYFNYGETYTIIITVDVLGVSDAHLEEEFRLTFETEILDIVAPELIQVVPQNASVTMLLTPDIYMEFSESIAGNAILEVIADGGFIVEGITTIEDNILRFYPTVPNSYGDMNVTVNLINDVKDLAGNIYMGIKTWYFMIEEDNTDIASPILVTLNPNKDITVPFVEDISMVFDENITGDGILELTETPSGHVVSGSTTLYANRLTFLPDTTLIPNISYTVTLLNSVEDLSSNLYAGVTSWMFFISGSTGYNSFSTKISVENKTIFHSKTVNHK